jgi:hypothetical protein
MFDIKPTMLSMILKDWEKIIKLHQHSTICLGRKRLQEEDYSKVEEAVNTWFKQVCSTGELVSGSMIQVKVKEFAHLINTDVFDARVG